MSDLSEKLALALNEMPFVRVVEHDQQGKALNVLCRIRPKMGVLWAAFAEKILREAAAREGTEEAWHVWVARVYMIRNDSLVYGWSFVFSSTDLETSLPAVIEVIQQFSIDAAEAIKPPVQPPPKKAEPKLRAVMPPSPVETADLDRGEPHPNDDDDYADGPALPKGHHPESDERGNPIVPRGNRIHRIPMAGLPSNFDRNAPDPDKRKGSWHLETKKGKAFRPPVRR